MIDTTFVVPCFNNHDSARRTLLSIRRQFQDAPLIIVDDGSDDETAAVLVSVQRETRGLLLRRSNGGKVRAVQSATPLIETPYVVLCDSDVEMQGYDWLQEHIALLQNPRVGLVSGCSNPDFRDDKFEVYNAAEYFGEPGYCESPNGGLVTTRLDVMQKVPHTYDSLLCEDAAWCMELKQAGYVCYTWLAQAVHRICTSSYEFDIRPTGPELTRLSKRYAHLLTPRRPAAELREFMRTGTW